MGFLFCGCHPSFDSICSSFSVLTSCKIADHPQVFIYRESKILRKTQEKEKKEGEEDSRRPSAEELFVARWRRRRFSLSRYSKTWSSWTALWWSWSYSCECCWNPAGVSRCPCSHLSSEPRLSCASPKPWQHFSPVCCWFIHIFPSSFCFRKQSLVLSFAQKLASGPRETRNFWSVSPSPSSRVFAEAGF